jgi:hypothetical protein
MEDLGNNGNCFQEGSLQGDDGDLGYKNNTKPYFFAQPHDENQNSSGQLKLEHEDKPIPKARFLREVSKIFDNFSQG